VISVLSPGRTGRFEKRGTVQPHVVVTSRITSGRSPRFTPVKVCRTGPSASRTEPKSQTAGSKTSSGRSSCAATPVAANAQTMSVMIVFLFMFLRSVPLQRYIFCEKKEQ